MAQLKYLVLHCTATPEGREVSSREIRAWHTNPVSKGGRGWQQVGYTDLIHLDGEVERLVDNNEDANVDPWEVTNGAKGYNIVSRHIAYVGGTDKQGKPKDTRTEAQKRSMADYVIAFHKRHPDVKIIGHRDLSPDKNCNGIIEPKEWIKSCPSFDVSMWLKSIGIKQ